MWSVGMITTLTCPKLSQTPGLAWFGAFGTWEISSVQTSTSHPAQWHELSAVSATPMHRTQAPISDLAESHLSLLFFLPPPAVDALWVLSAQCGHSLPNPNSPSNSHLWFPWETANILLHFQVISNYYRVFAREQKQIFLLWVCENYRSLNCTMEREIQVFWWQEEIPNSNNTIWVGKSNYGGCFSFLFVSCNFFSICSFELLRCWRQNLSNLLFCHTQHDSRKYILFLG